MVLPQTCFIFSSGGCGGYCLRGKLFNNANFDKKFKIKQMDTKVMPTQEHGRNRPRSPRHVGPLRALTIGS